MNLDLLIPGITTTGLLAVALWLGRNFLLTRLTRSVEHEFNRKLEDVRAELRIAEERLKADLRAKEVEISALRAGALSALANRQAALDKRRLEAVDQIWSAVTALGPARALAASMSYIDFEVAAKAAEQDPKARQFFEMIGAGFDPKSMDLTEAVKARPFVSPMVWAVYSAMQAVIAHSIIRWHVLKGGLGTKDFANHEAIAKLIKSALPHYADYIDKQGPEGYYYVLEALDQRLLAEMRAMLSGTETDKAAIEQAAEILRTSEEVIREAAARKNAA